MNIVTERAWYGWYAFDADTYDGDESDRGHGDTEQDAKDDLRERTDRRSNDERSS